MKAVLKDVMVLSVEKNDFVGKEGDQVYLSNVYLYDENETKVAEYTIRDNNALAQEFKKYQKKIANVEIDIRAQKGQYSYFVNVVGISANSKTK